jgi:hypothetical protein
MGRGLVEEAILHLSNRCDGAVKLDGVGWNKFDAHLGHSFADQIMRGKSLSVKQRNWVKMTLPKYRRQIHNWGEVKEILPEWVKEAEVAAEKRDAIDPTLPRLTFNKEEKKFYLFVKPGEEGLGNIFHSPRWIGHLKACRYLSNITTVKSFLEHGDKIKTVEPAAGEEIARIINMDNRKKVREQEVQEGIDKVRDLKNLGDLSGVKLPLNNKWIRREHQVRAFLIGTTVNYSAMFMEQRTGKTPVGVAISGERFLRGEVKRALVICPLTVVGSWKRDGFEKLAGFPHRVVILDGKVDDRKKVLKTWKDTPGELQVAITNFDSVAQLVEDIKKWRPDLIVIDESQKIKNGRAQRSKAIHQLTNVAKYRVILTGTPITQSPLDIHSQFKFLNPNIFGKVFGKFRDKYVVMGGFGGYKIVGYKILPTLPDGSPNPYHVPELEKEFMDKVHGVAFRITKQEVDNLPPPEPQFLYAALEPEALNLYKQMEKHALLEIGKDTVTAPIILTQLLRLQQITGGFIPLEEEGKAHQVSQAKIRMLNNKLDELLEDDKKVVVFARFIPEVLAIDNLLNRKKIKHHILYGKIKANQRDGMIVDFQTNPDTRVFVVQISTGGVGITLDAADAEIFYSANFSLNDYQQAQARIMAMDKANKEIYNIVAENTVDEDIMNILAHKGDLARMVVDDLKNIFKRGGNGMRVVSKKAQEVVDKGKGAVKVTEAKDAELDKLLNELEDELKKAGVSPNAACPAPGREKPTTQKKIKIKIKKETPKPETPVRENTGKGFQVAPAPASDEQIVTLKELAAEVKMDPKKLRKWLRTNIGKAEGRWEWNTTDPTLAKIKEELKS